jgi:hypothetical protein
MPYQWPQSNNHFSVSAGRLSIGPKWPPETNNAKDSVCGGPMTEARRIRAKAQQLRDHLQQQQDKLDAQLAVAGISDPIRQVTGQSSLERALQSTNDMIRSLDRVLHEHAPPPIVTTVSGFSRTSRSRLGLSEHCI